MAQQRSETPSSCPYQELRREQDSALAMLARTCRVAEGIGGMDVSKTLGLVWLATATDATSLDAKTASALRAFFLKKEASVTTPTKPAGGE